ncbi:DUF2332 domain-containing protein [Sphingomonas sp. A2-49]|uniref:DUF2332 domain-containing protein n=1 Tax=Sphingomonas sp. A2-49 TaxID=1391375 RepID=UPI0021D31FE4|nr:DUF2332 domain-containing protein [Sphingomonas sp. A2-49]MCU6453964.1 DUF2332 domain-containing protein [Sphingomonas sp. A2-49]
MAGEAENRAAFGIQAEYCAAMAAPVTARLCAGLATALDRDSATGRRALDWPGEPVADALALRLVGGLHALHRAGVDPALSRLFAGDDADIDAVLRVALVRHDATLLPWLDGPPQTNEAARSAGLMTGLLHLARRYGPRIEVLEIGSSAGLNLMIGRYRFDLGGVGVGPPDAAVRIAPAWRGVAPPAAKVAIVGARGVDIAPVDVADPAQAARLAAYVWVDAQDRLARLAAAIGEARAQGVDLAQGDAADWVEARLAEPQAAGVTRVLMHSVVWQYLTDDARMRIVAAMAAAAASASTDRPLGWVMMEPNRDLHRHEVRVRGWPAETPMELVALTHAHGAWVEGLAPPYATRDYVMRRGAYEAD